MFRCFLVTDFTREHEQITFSKLFAKIKSSNPKTNFNIIVQPSIQGSTPDIIIITNDLIAVADFKSGFGKVTGNENSPWMCENIEINKGRENPYQQIHKYKFDLLNYLKNKIDTFFQPEFIEDNLNLGHIKGFVIFDEIINYDHSQLSEGVRKWFKVTCVERFLDDLYSLPRAQINLKDEDVDTLIFKILNLNETQIINTYPINEPIKLEPEKTTNIPIKINVKPDSPTHKKILQYYRYCLVLEDLKSTEIPEDAFKLNFNSPDLFPSSFVIPANPQISEFIRRGSTYSRSQNIQLLFAYPVAEDKIPVFFSTADYHFDRDEDEYKFTLSKPEITKSFISKKLGISDPEDLEFIKSKIDQIDSFKEKIKEIKNNLNQEINPEQIDEIFKKSTAYLFWSSWGANYKVIRELQEIEKLSETEILNSTLYPFIYKKPITQNKTQMQNITILPFSDINKEQTLAVESAFKNPLTVVTGPPGTGKTQISFNIMANAILNNKTVLFATKNNKAVDDVCKKFENLFSNTKNLTPLIRVGNRETLKKTSDYVSRAINTIEDMKAQINEYTKKSLEIEINNIKSDVEKIENELKKIELLKRSEYNRKEHINFIKTYTEHVKQIKSKIIAKLEIEKEKFLSEYPEPFVNLVYNQKIKLPFTYAQIKRIIKKYNSRPNLIERFFAIFDKNYREKKFNSIFHSLTSRLPKEVKDLIEIKSKTLQDKFNLLLIASELQEKVEYAFSLDEKIKLRREDLQKFELSNNKVIEDLENKLLEITTTIKKVEPLTQKLNESLNKLKEELVNKSKSYLSLIFWEKLFNSKSSIPGLRIFKSKLDENQPPVPENIFKKVLDVFPIFATTSLSVGNAVPLEKNLFDILIIDEASQSDIPSALPLILRSKNVVIIGDPMQLKHISGLKSEEDITIANKCFISEFKLTYNNTSLYTLSEYISNISLNPIIFLVEHYRSHESIINFSNKHFYSHIGRELIHKTPQQNLKFKHKGILWLDVKGEEKNKINIQEAKELEKILRNLIPQLSTDISIGVTTPFRNQADYLRAKLSHLIRPEIDAVDTVHRFQGDEKDVMFLSLVVSPNSEPSLLWFINEGAKQLLNVAVTRARSCIIVLGDYDYALSHKPQKRFTTDYIKALANSSNPINDVSVLL
jgi:hypothetical protein